MKRSKERITVRRERERERERDHRAPKLRKASDGAEYYPDIFSARQNIDVYGQSWGRGLKI